MPKISQFRWLKEGHSQINSTIPSPSLLWTMGCYSFYILLRAEYTTLLPSLMKRLCSITYFKNIPCLSCNTNYVKLGQTSITNIRVPNFPTCKSWVPKHPYFILQRYCCNYTIYFLSTKFQWSIHFWRAKSDVSNKEHEMRFQLWGSMRTDPSSCTV
jgi:hypothetical protein